ncbi:CAF17-like 4Fe-4S cluster assembly/insertion protein YgfZ [Segnochrobactrum spirostomi]|uniref:Folate-binding protein YgfZ n=1 Tax=Segnochrobactrum spirostomi TaxID=2608987 RepID=A0A6A7Y4E6_9HYPH|nr:folate-binding protein YgfZ [Segnochrobactrum spirostomi]MQT14010.1 folate-binding protein YgfZ [Segnochrobactrum spirostomi]
MGGAFVTELTDRAVVRISGPDTRPFLQALVTSDVLALSDSRAGYAALLTPQGKILFDFLIAPTSDGVVLDVAAPLAADLVRRLGFYKLRAKIEIRDTSADETVLAFWAGDPPPILPGVVFQDPRLAALGHRAIVPRAALATVYALPLLSRAVESAWHAHRIALGVPEGGRDFGYGETFPHDADMDALAGVDFRKGCYVGQEVVSRMQHRATARRRIVQVESAGGALPAPGTPLTAGDRPLGVLGSAAGAAGLALVRLDRAKEAADGGTPVMAGDVPVALKLPAWATFGWPETGAASAAD